VSLRVGVLVVQNLPWATWRDRVLEVERLGYDGVYVWDHLVHRTQTLDDPLFDGLTLLSAAAALTSRVALGTLVASPTLRHPVLLAKQAMTVDQVSGGRVELGIGAAGVLLDYAALGVEPWSKAEQVERFTDTVQIVDAVLRGARSYEGTHWSGEGVSMAPGSVRQPRLTLTVAAHGPRTLRVAGRYADVWNSITPRDLPRDEGLALTAHRARLLHEAATEAGRDPAGIRRSVLIGSDAWPVLSSPAAFRDAVLRYRDLGVHEVVLAHPDHPGEAKVGHGEAAPDIVRRIAEDVLPQLRAELV
jgi:alkanesulfonate monooxygenase SsuD/methylene tetrahydromethanopterin reductase-like flavin-dependent oxidoreductase (luciferase family)